MVKKKDNQANTLSKRRCVVCYSREGPLFAFPKEEGLRERWKKLCNLRVISKRSEICHRHFKKEEVLRGNGRAKLLVTDRLEPSLLLDPEPRRGSSTLAKVSVCAVPGCHNKEQDGGVSLHWWPRLHARRQKWAELCKLKTVPKRQTVICSAHFVATDFLTKDDHYSHDKRKLKAAAIPSLNLPPEKEANMPRPADPVQESQPVDQEDRVEAGNSSVEPVPPQEDNLPECSCPNEGTVDDGRSLDTLLSEETDSDVREVLSTYHRLSTSLISDINDIVNSSTVSDVPSAVDTEGPRDGKRSVGTQTESKKLNLFDLISNDTQLKAFTGVSFTTLNILLKLALEISEEKCEITLENKILLTLCKLRLNVSYECLSALVGFDRRRCGEFFASTLHLLSLVLKHTVYWPSKEEVALNMPKCFRKYRDTRVILDCTEVSVITPHCLRCKIRTYSHYKGGQTVKILVGVTPSGLISFVSKVYGGRTSDKQIFEENDIVKNNLLEPFIDAVMVDKGFRIDDFCNEGGIKMHRPPFIVKKQALSSPNAKRNAEIANARVHVERIMQRLKVFKILQGKLPWSMVPFLDDIVTVIAGLVNVGSPILAEERFMTFEKV